MNASVISVIFAIFALINGIFGNDKKVVCYYGSWSTYREGDGQCQVETIDPTLCTHLIYTFIGLNTDATIRVLDGWNDLPEGKNGFARFNALKELNPSLKTLIAIGGWNEGSPKYSEVTNNPALRSKFVENVVNFVLKYGFDGFDFDWEYPNQRNGIPSDKESFIATMKELHEAFQPHGLLLSCAVAAAKSSASQSYLISELNPHVDLINLMAYDLHGAWDPTVGINSPLYPRNDESAEIQENLNVDACVNYWIDNGADPKKLVLGIPLYGRSFKLAEKNNFQPGAPSAGTGIPGKYSKEAGMLGYNEILELDDGGWTHYWDSEGKVPFMVKDFDWIGYDDKESVTIKTQYAVERGLGGVMVWSVETDDLTGYSGEKFILLKTINNVLNGDLTPSNTTSTSTTSTSSTSSTSTTSTTTTTQQPPTPPDTNICKHEGLVRDPNDCSVYYQCSLESDGYHVFRFQCGAGTYFNDKTLVCDYPENVVC